MFPEIIPARRWAAIDGFVDHLVTIRRYAGKPGATRAARAGVAGALLRNSPWWAVVAATVVLAWLVSRRIGLSLAMGALLCVIGGMWDAGMQTLALMIMAAGLSVLIGIPLGVLMARVNWLRSVMLPVLDVMQTMPSRLPDSRGDAVRPGQDPRHHRHRHLRRAAADPPDRPGHPPGRPRGAGSLAPSAPIRASSSSACNCRWPCPTSWPASTRPR